MGSIKVISKLVSSSTLFFQNIALGRLRQGASVRQFDIGIGLGRAAMVLNFAAIERSITSRRLASTPSSNSLASRALQSPNKRGAAESGMVSMASEPLRMATSRVLVSMSFSSPRKNVATSAEKSAEWSINAMVMRWACMDQIMLDVMALVSAAYATNRYLRKKSNLAHLE